MIWLCLIYAAFMSPIYLHPLAVLCKITRFYALFKWAISQFVCHQSGVVFSRRVNHSWKQLLLMTNRTRCWSLILEMCLLSNHFYRGFSDLVTNTRWNLRRFVCDCIHTELRLFVDINTIYHSLKKDPFRKWAVHLYLHSLFLIK